MPVPKKFVFARAALREAWAKGVGVPETLTTCPWPGWVKSVIGKPWKLKDVVGMDNDGNDVPLVRKGDALTETQCVFIVAHCIDKASAHYGTDGSKIRPPIPAHVFGKRSVNQLTISRYVGSAYSGDFAALVKDAGFSLSKRSKRDPALGGAWRLRMTIFKTLAKTLCMDQDFFDALLNIREDPAFEIVAKRNESCYCRSENGVDRLLAMLVRGSDGQMWLLTNEVVGGTCEMCDYWENAHCSGFFKWTLTCIDQVFHSGLMAITATTAETADADFEALCQVFFAENEECNDCC